MNHDENPYREPQSPGRAASNGRLGFRLIGAMKVASGLLLAAAGFGIFRMLNRDLGASLEHFVTRLHLDPENRLVHETVSRVAGIDQAHLKALGVGTFFYALLHLVEGTGLILLKPWAEYLTVIATGVAPAAGTLRDRPQGRRRSGSACWRSTSRSSSTWSSNSVSGRSAPEN